VGLERVELPTRSLGISLIFINSFAFRLFVSVAFVVFWACLGPNLQRNLRQTLAYGSDRRENVARRALGRRSSWAVGQLCSLSRQKAFVQ
jgi:hypothetical protein